MHIYDRYSVGLVVRCYPLCSEYPSSNTDKLCLRFVLSNVDWKDNSKLSKVFGHHGDWWLVRASSSPHSSLEPPTYVPTCWLENSSSRYLEKSVDRYLQTMLMLMYVSTGSVRFVLEALQVILSPWSFLCRLTIRSEFRTRDSLLSTSSTMSSIRREPLHQDTLGRGSPPIVSQIMVRDPPSVTGSV